MSLRFRYNIILKLTKTSSKNVTYVCIKNVQLFRCQKTVYIYRCHLRRTIQTFRSKKRKH